VVIKPYYISLAISSAPSIAHAHLHPTLDSLLCGLYISLDIDLSTVHLRILCDSDGVVLVAVVIS